MTWPPRWDKPHFKHDQPNRKVVERQDKLKLVAAERKAKEKVRDRDKRCRFPLCGCKKFRRHTEVSHSEHKGMGGNPAGDRSTSALMVLLCPFRHKENRYSIDRGLLKWEPLTDKGADGPIQWLMAQNDPREPWLIIARETAVQQIEKSTRTQRAHLTRLAEMDI